MDDLTCGHILLVNVDSEYCAVSLPLAMVGVASVLQVVEPLKTKCEKIFNFKAICSYTLQC